MKENNETPRSSIPIQQTPRSVMVGWMNIITLILVVLLVVTVKGAFVFWAWSTTVVEGERERTMQEIFKRKETAVHFYEVKEDYDMLFETLGLSLEGREQLPTDSIPAPEEL